MGCGSSKEINISKANNIKGKEIEILAELCSSWGYENMRDQVVCVLIKELNSLGYDVKYEIKAVMGFSGEFFVYVIKDGKKSIKFSNFPKHKSDRTEIGDRIDSKNIKNIIEKIEDSI